MLRIGLKWGVVLGIAICACTLCVHPLGWYTTDLAKGQLADQMAIILPVAALFLAIRDYSRYQTRTATLVEAVGVGALSGWFQCRFPRGSCGFTTITSILRGLTFSFPTSVRSSRIPLFRRRESTKPLRVWSRAGPIDPNSWELVSARS